ncbi:hypothetical protein DL93DRAFT_2230023, partial [Clavulina sp. PMI_390]
MLATHNTSDEWTELDLQMCSISEIVELCSRRSIISARAAESNSVMSAQNHELILINPEPTGTVLASLVILPGGCWLLGLVVGQQGSSICCWRIPSQLRKKDNLCVPKLALALTPPPHPLDIPLGIPIGPMMYDYHILDRRFNINAGIFHVLLGLDALFNRRL